LTLRSSIPCFIPEIPNTYLALCSSVAGSSTGDHHTTTPSSALRYPFAERPRCNGAFRFLR
jgi:hypothetical protein